MQKIYPDLYIGNSTDAYVSLYVHDQPGGTSIMGVLDVSRTLPSRKWHRAKHIALSKVGFVEGKAMPTEKFRKALQFIHEQRSSQKAVLVAYDKHRDVAVLICIAYLMWRKKMTWDEALNHVQLALGSDITYPVKDKERIENALTKWENELAWEAVLS